MTAKKVGGDSAELNYDMNYNLFLLKTSMQNLKTAQGNIIIYKYIPICVYLANYYTKDRYIVYI